jgi:hypothetical protein
MKVRYLTETNLYFDTLDLPKGYELDKEDLIHDMIFSKEVKNNLYPTTTKDYFIEHSKNVNRIYEYIKDHMQLQLNSNIMNRKYFAFSKEIDWCNLLYPTEEYHSNGVINPVDLKHSPDYTVIYAVKTSPCFLIVYYDDNRRAGRSYKLDIKENEFYIFPSTLKYEITRNNSNDINYFYCMGLTHNE